MMRIFKRKRTIDKPYHHGDLRAALLAGAANLLEADGAEGVSLRAVARTVGVSQTAQYNHFESKEALLVALAAEGFKALRQSQESAVEALPAGSDPVEALGLDYVLFALGRPQRYRLMFGVGLKGRCALDAVAEAKHASFVPLRTALAKRMKNSNSKALDAAAVAAWAFVHGLASLVNDGSLNDPQLLTRPRASRTFGAIRAFSKTL